MSERIKIEIDDTELDAFMLRLDTVLGKSEQTFGTRNVMDGAQRAQAEMGALVWLLRSGQLTDEQMKLLSEPERLPGINRELRLILGRIPGMREAIQYYFRLKRLQRGSLLGGAQLWLTIVATTLVLMREIQQMQKKQEQELAFLRDMFREYMTDPKELDIFVIENRLTWLEKMTERIMGWLGMVSDDITPEDPWTEPMP